MAAVIGVYPPDEAQRARHIVMALADGVLAVAPANTERRAPAAITALVDRVLVIGTLRAHGLPFAALEARSPQAHRYLLTLRRAEVVVAVGRGLR
ncbi:MAG: hypothetical protein ACYDEB_04815 [Dehalococcoidia bacterium]